MLVRKGCFITDNYLFILIYDGNNNSVIPCITDCFLITALSTLFYSLPIWDTAYTYIFTCSCWVFNTVYTYCNCHIVHLTSVVIRGKFLYLISDSISTERPGRIGVPEGFRAINQATNLKINFIDPKNVNYKVCYLNVYNILAISRDFLFPKLSLTEHIRLQTTCFWVTEVWFKVTCQARSTIYFSYWVNS